MAYSETAIYDWRIMLKRLIHIAQIELTNLVLIGGEHYAVTRIGLFPRKMIVTLNRLQDEAPLELTILDPSTPCEIYIPLA